MPADSAIEILAFPPFWRRASAVPSIKRMQRRSGARAPLSGGRWLAGAPARSRRRPIMVGGRLRCAVVCRGPPPSPGGARLIRVMCSMPGFSSQLAGWQRRNIMADNAKKPMSRLMKLANKFNCFYLSGKRTRRVAPAPPRIVPGDASPGRVIDRNDAAAVRADRRGYRFRVVYVFTARGFAGE